MNAAILGANGFVGYRLFELWQLHGPHRPRAIVRSPSSLARVARFEADWRLADACDAAALAKAFAGCEAVVHCVVGDERVIAETIDAPFRAAQAAGVQVFVYLSSASVHGQNPPPGTTDESPLRDDQPNAYNNAKVRAERRLHALARNSTMRVVVLRPGIVWGPRSRWIADAAEALIERRARWIDGGRGVCNSIFVDNLVRAIECAIAARDVHQQAFYVGDPEALTWGQLFLGVSEGLGFAESDWREARPWSGVASHSRFAHLKGTTPVQAVLPWFSPRLKESVKAALARWNRPPPADPWALAKRDTVGEASPEMTALFACRTRLSDEKARRHLHYTPPVAFAEGLRISVEWLRAAGYPRAEALR